MSEFISDSNVKMRTLDYEMMLSLTGFSSSTLSSDGAWLAVCSANKVIVRQTESPQQVSHTFQCVDKIDKVDFSPDGGYLLCAQYNRQAVQVFSLSDPSWKCRINESAAGLIQASWAPNSRAILTESDFGIQMSLWSLTDGSQAVISLPKPAQRHFRSQQAAFSHCGRFLGVLHRIDLQDMIGVYSLYPPVELVKFKCRSGDVNEVGWLPSGHLITLDSPLTYKCCIYNPSGELLCAFEAYQHALGLRVWTTTLPLSPPLNNEHLDGVGGDMSNSNGGFNVISSELTVTGYLVLGSFDGKIRLLSMSTWALAYTLPLVHIKDMDPLIRSADSITTVEVGEGGLAEGEETDHLLPDPSMVAAGFVARMLKALPKGLCAPTTLRSSASPANPPLPSFGVNWIGVSPSTRYLAATEENHPRCIWIWDIAGPRLQALLVLRSPVSNLVWRPVANKINGDEDILTFVTSGPYVYFWSPQSGVRKVDHSLSGDILLTHNVSTLKWSSSGSHLLLKGRDAVSLCRINYATEHK